MSVLRSLKVWHSAHYIGRNTTRDARTRSSCTDICAEHGSLLRAPWCCSPKKDGCADEKGCEDKGTVGPLRSICSMLRMVGKDDMIAKLDIS